MLRACVGEAGSSSLTFSTLQAKIEPQAFTPFKPLPSPQPSAAPFPNHYACRHHPNTQAASFLSAYTAETA
jgi:hypothetical protein